MTKRAVFIAGMAVGFAMMASAGLCGDVRTPPVTVKWEEAKGDALSVSVTNHTDKPVVVDGKVWLVAVEEGKKYDLRAYAKRGGDLFSTDLVDGVYYCFMEFVVPDEKWKGGKVSYTDNWAPLNDGGLPEGTHTVQPGKTIVLQSLNRSGMYLGTKDCTEAMIGLETTEKAIMDFPIRLVNGVWQEKR